MTDSTTLEEWLIKTNFIENGESPIQATICLEVVCLHALHYLSHKIQEYSQWFCREDIQVADALSRDDDRTDEELTKILLFHCPSQVSKHFRIVPLPSKITLWLTLLLLWLTVKPGLAEEHTKTMLGRGAATSTIATALFSWQHPPITENQTHEGFCHDSAWRAIFEVGWWSPGSKVSHKYHQCSGCNLQGKLTRRPPQGCGAQRWPTSTMATEIVHDKLSKRETTKSLSVYIHHLILSSQSTELRCAVGKLAVDTNFWAMWLCEYSKVTKTEQQQTKQLCLQNITFINGGNNLDHLSPELSLADYVSITFERQKNDRKSDTMTQWRVPDPVMCPVKLWTSIITWIFSYKGTNKDSPVSLAQHRNKIIIITSEMISNLLRDVVITIGKPKLGIQCSEAGTHSIQSGDAMTMYLAGIPIFSIMPIGRWLSLAFLKHIRRQVQEFSHGISPKMIEVQSFKHINNPTTTNTKFNCWWLVFVADGINW
jgi:hypothetical protein